MIELPAKARTYFNEKSGALVKLLKSRKEKLKDNHRDLSSSIAHKHAISLDFTEFTRELKDQFGVYASEKNGVLTGFLDTDSRAEYLKFVRSLYKQRKIKTHISYDFLESTCFSWMIRSYNQEKLLEFSEYLIKELNSNCRMYWIFFPIIFLEIEKNFHSGKVSIDFLKDADFDSFSKSIGLDKERVSDYKRRFTGQVMASIALGPCDREKAKIEGFKTCGLAIDALKLYCQTVDNPKVYTDFDIEYRVRLNPRMQFLTMEIEMIVDGVSINPKDLLLHEQRNPNHFFLTKEYYQRMVEQGFDIVSAFISKPRKNEIGDLVKKGIQLFAVAISTGDIYRRIVDLFIIIESFLIRNETEPILTSLTKYFPKLVTKKPEDRNLVKQALTSLYSVRSAVVHHGKNKKVDLQELAILQTSIRIMIIRFIEMSYKNEKKDSILNEIDEAIEKAY